MDRSDYVRRAAACVFALMLPAASAAQDQPAPYPELLPVAAAMGEPGAFLLSPGTPRLVPLVTAIPPTVKRRPAALMPLYVSFASLQALDTHSTRRALARGATEANPLMRGIAGNTAGMLAVKAAATAGVVYAGEKIWKRNKAGAVLFMVAANSALALVVQHNYRLVH